MTTSALTRPVALTLRIPALAVAAGLAIGFTCLYWVLGPSTAGGSMYVPLAEAFLHGRLDVEPRSWLELVPLDGRWYAPLPPVPAITLMPVVALMGPQTWWTELAPNVPAAIFGGLNVSLVYMLTLRCGVRLITASVLAIGFATATHMWIAGNGGPHHYAQLTGAFFLLVGLLTAQTRRVPGVAGLMLGLAAGCRLPLGLALPFLLALYDRRPSRAHLALLAGVAAVAIPVALYNVARFGSPLDFGYARIPSGTGIITDEPWYADGILSLTYIPRSLAAALLSGFNIVSEAPFLKPTWQGLSLFITAPVLFLAGSACGPLVKWAWLAVAAVMLPNLAHGAWGFAQYGYRFALDATPILMVLLAWAYQNRSPDRKLLAAVTVGAIANLYGFWAAGAGFFT